MASSINLLLSLPSSIQSEVYQYDNTYRIFGNEDFKQELSSAYFKSNVVLHRCLKEITDHMTDLIDEGNTCWHNEYGRIDPEHELISKNLPNYNSEEDFIVVSHYEYDVLYFKILPKGACYENCKFFHNIFHKTKIYDGYFRNENKNNNLSKNQLDDMCIGYTSNIGSYNMNDELIEQDISMYFV